MILLTTTQTLETVLAANAAANQLTYTTHYIDEVLSTFQLGALGASDGVTNDTTTVTMVSAPTTGVVRKVSGLSLYNGDTVAAIVTIQVNDNSTTRTIWKGLLIDGDTLTYTDLRGFGILNSSGEWRVAMSNIGASSSSASASVAAHATSHELGGTDVIPLDTLGGASDTTNLNASSTKHGLSPKSPADATQFLNGAATPAYAQVKDSDLSTSDVTTNNATSAKHGFLKKLSNTASDVLRGDGTFGGVNPGLTAGSIIYAGASGTSLAEDNAVLFYDATNHRQGIGLTSPKARLNVMSASEGLPATSGTAVTGHAIIEGGTHSNMLIAGTDSSSPFGGWLQVSERTALGTSYPLLLNPRGGNVGIGTTNPTKTLDVTGTLNASGNTTLGTTQNFSWNAKSVDTVYQAASDGLVVATIDTSAGGGTFGYLTGLSDAANPPTTLRGGANADSSSLAYGTLTMPVRKGDFYEIVSHSGAGSPTYTIFWVPLGTAG